MPFAYVRFGLLVADVHAAEEDAHAPGHVFRPVAGEVPALAAHLLLRILQAQVADEQVRHDAALREGHEHVEGALVPDQLLKAGLSDLDFIAKSSKIKAWPWKNRCATGLSTPCRAFSFCTFSGIL